MSHESDTLSPVLQRSYYANSVKAFLQTDSDTIVGRLSAESLCVERTQILAWQEQIRQVSEALRTFDGEGQLFFEFTIPRLGKRIDCVLVLRGIVWVLEFKVGAHAFTSTDVDQVWDYALDLKNFHETSHEALIVPVLIATEAPAQTIQGMLAVCNDGLVRPVRAGSGQLAEVLAASLAIAGAGALSFERWAAGRYLPTPTIVEAARALYAGHGVSEISRSDAGAANLAQTAKMVDAIIQESRTHGRKSICFVTGVPGAGKTLVGLDIATRHMDATSDSYSVFLSGNGPLVAVLREALSRDLVERSQRSGQTVTKGDARRRVGAFIQNVHHFRDACLADERPPVEHVALFDEAQRAWNRDQTSKFMAGKKGKPGFAMSEPEFLISCLDRHADWAVVVCLVGGGQEINTGEAGIVEWISAIQDRYPDWHLHISPALAGSEYRAERLLAMLQGHPNAHFNETLHLATSMRSFRAESLSHFVKLVLDLDHRAAADTLRSLTGRYPLVLTRSVDTAKRWLKQQARGSERFGLVVSSQAQRLKPHAIDVRVAVDPVHWFLHGKDDVRSSYFLEDVATEFQVQGLELDWVGVVWDADLRYGQNGWQHHAFVGSRWQNVKAPERQRYLENAYRVLLTRARQGMILVIPDGDEADPTRAPALYDPTFQYIQSLGVPVL